MLRILGQTGAREIHVVGADFVDSPMAYRNPHCFMGTELRSPEYLRSVTSAQKVRELVRFDPRGLRRRPMQLHTIDWLILVAYVTFALAVGVGFARRASANVDEFFLTGRSLPWWLAGTSMVATTFAADTPLVITGLGA